MLHDDLELMSIGKRSAEELFRSVFRVDVAKALDPLSQRDFDVIVARLARAVSSVAAPEQTKALRQALARLDVDWAAMSAEQRLKIIEAARQPIASIPSRVIPGIEHGFKIESVKIIGDTKRSTILRHKLKLSPSLSSGDENVAAYVARTPGNFVRDSFGVRSEVFAARARAIVERNLREGYGRREIGEELHRELAGLGKTQSYWTMVASVFACRARSYGQLSSFAEAGIDEFTWESVLDEVTSVQCRFLHGKSFSVAKARENFARADSSDDPEAIRSINPFLSHGKDEDGNEAVFIGRGAERQLVARVDENAVGRRDQTGRFSRAMGAEALQAAGVAAPPAHGNCRSTIVPSDKSLTVPAPAPRAVAPPPAAPAPRAPRARPSPAATPPAPAASPWSFTPAPPAQPARPARPAAPAPAVSGPPREGVHFMKLKTNLPQPLVDTILGGIDKAGLGGFLQANPLKELNLKKSFGKRSAANGAYWKAGHRLDVRGVRTAGRPLQAGSSWSISSSAPTAAEAPQRTFVHELGHHVHLFDKRSRAHAAVDSVISTAFARTTSIVTKYGGTNHREYFAESFAAYVYEKDALKKHDPTGFRMVEEVLKLRGIKGP